MKKILLVLSMGLVFVACSNQSKQPTALDTMAIKQQAILEEQARIQTENDRRDSIEALHRRLSAAIKKEARYDDASATAPAQEQAPAQAAPAKKGWSDAAKGTVLGAGVGAVAGALIDKNHVQGAVIGGVVGAGTGYVVGRAKDRKTGRVVKKKPVEPQPQQQ